MGLFIDNENDIELKVNYVYDEKDEICVLSKSDMDYLSKLFSGEEKKDKKIGWEIHFNSSRVKALSVKKENICEINIGLRRPSFEDVSSLVAPLSNVNSANGLGPSQIIDFNSKRMMILFKSGYALDKGGIKYDIDTDKMLKLSPNIGIGLAFAMNEAV
jgi:hypothetical protein